jgi:hypothetical protein
MFVVFLAATWEWFPRVKNDLKPTFLIEVLLFVAVMLIVVAS